MNKMAADNSILEVELKSQLEDLKQTLHMKGVKALSRKQYGLLKLVTQRKQIRLLENQIRELEPTVTMLYSPQHVLKDNQIKGYLVYLLQLKEFFSREVETKKEIIRQREEQIRKLIVKLCAMRNEYAKKKRNVPRKTPEFVLLENMSNRMNQIEKRICTLQHENKEFRESIMDLRIFLKQYKKFEIEFREKIKHMANEAQMHLDRAVQTYEEREDFLSKRDIYKDRCAQDLRKTAINENSLNLILENTKDFEEFGTLQKQERSDSRIAITGDLIEQGVTGLEPALNKVQNLHSVIVASSGKETPKEMEDHFKLTDHQANSMFSYLEELLKMVHHTQYIIDDVREKNKSLLINLSDQERRLRWEIEETKDKVEQSRSEADAAMECKDQARGELDELLQKVQSLYLKCISDMKTKRSTDQKDEEETGESEGSEKEEIIDTLQDEEIDDSNAVEFNENFERKVLELLTLLEYIRMKERGEEELEPQLGQDEDEPIIEEPPEIDYLDTISPRSLRSKIDLQCLSDLHHTSDALPLDQLKSKAVTAVSEIESGLSSASERRRKKD